MEPGAEKIFGFTAAEVLNKPLTILSQRPRQAILKFARSGLMEKGPCGTSP